ncbi:alpha/beta hydrolase [Actinokineospora fastidiosa]|uniref:Uncharacterized protein n=1 Tax=Actinokineospora fastidiosa TaxID=1816 RepID=A0A918GP92_9PSEU|nr:alpha/beta hydrolase family protein [Actinokineospora fastidiosa]GGS49273.1 hypothetical protein GCM10010171_50470 [Actinokineospora fastidiosa]
MNRRAAVLAAVTLAAALTPTAAAQPVSADDGARVVAETRVDERTIDLRVESPALGATAPVRLLVPQGWEPGAGRSWPVLWLLHGCCEPADYESWTRFTDVAAFTADQPVLVVMPSGGAIGMYSDWWNWGLSDRPDWREFHMVELWQILQRGYGAGDRAAIAGLSMGGYGALEYATRFPGRFGAVASYSAAPNVLAPGLPEVTQLNLISQGFPVWGLLWGDPWLNRARWRDHNPYDKVDLLRGARLYISAGDGARGPLDDAGKPIVPGLLESVALTNSRGFADKLRRSGIPATTDFYTPGTHSWPYWERALRRSWPVLADGLGI